MRSGVMEHCGLSKSFVHAEGWATDHHRPLRKDLTISLHEGEIIALTGIVGRGTTVLLVRLQDQLSDEGQLAVADSLTFRVERVNLDRPASGRGRRSHDASGAPSHRLARLRTRQR